MIRRISSGLALLLLLLIASSSAVLAQGVCEYYHLCIGVNSTGDAPDAYPGDDVCETDTPGECTLRAAIMEANAHPDMQPDEAIAIGFAIDDPGSVQTIQPQSALPTISVPVMIDGWTQGGSGYTGPPLIVLDGSEAGYVTAGLDIAGGNSAVRGLNIRNFKRLSGIWSGPADMWLHTNGGNLIVGNYLGTDHTGMVHVAPTNLRVESANNTIGGPAPEERNVITVGGALDGGGVELRGPGATGNIVQGNYIGTDASGSAALCPDGGVSVVISHGASGNTIGGTTTGAGNVINGAYGIYIINDGTTGNAVQGNYIGTDATGTVSLGGELGVAISVASDNVIGGATPEARNVISGHSLAGVGIADSGTSGNVVQGNYIGTDASGLAPLGNAVAGVAISNTYVPQQAGPTDNTITENLIAYNGMGVCIDGASTVSDPLRNAIRGNAIHSNLGLGIELAPDCLNDLDGVTPNDHLDADTGPNNFQNYATLDVVTTDGASTTVYGRLHSAPDLHFTLEAFSNSVCDPSGYGEGEVFLGSQDSYTLSEGDIAVYGSIDAPAPVGSFVTTTITDADGNTSEFSACQEVVADSDNDNIVDTVDPQLGQFGNDFEDFISDDIPPTTGVVNRGEKQFVIADAPDPDGVRIIAYPYPDAPDPDGVRSIAHPYLYTGPTTSTVCGGLELIPSASEVMDIVVSCPTGMQIEVIEGSVEIRYTLPDGSLLSTVLTEGYGLTMDADTLSFSAPASNPGPVVISVGGTEIEVLQGHTDIYQAPIDIKPGSEPNCFNSDGHGVIPVAILSTSFLDATQVDPASAMLDGQGVRVRGNGDNSLAHVEDVNGDGVDDLVVQIEDLDGTYEPGEATATLTGTTYDGITFTGTDSICIVP